MQSGFSRSFIHFKKFPTCNYNSFDISLIFFSRHSCLFKMKSHVTRAHGVRVMVCVSAYLREDETRVRLIDRLRYIYMNLFEYCKYMSLIKNRCLLQNAGVACFVRNSRECCTTVLLSFLRTGVGPLCLG